MNRSISLSEAKAKLSELINRVHFAGERFIITRKGKAVATVAPISEAPEGDSGRGLIDARGVLPEAADDIEAMIKTIYENRLTATERGVDL